MEQLDLYGRKGFNYLMIMALSSIFGCLERLLTTFAHNFGTINQQIFCLTEYHSYNSTGKEFCSYLKFSFNFILEFADHNFGKKVALISHSGIH